MRKEVGTGTNQSTAGINNLGSSKGRIIGFEPIYGGSIPSPRTSTGVHIMVSTGGLEPFNAGSSPAPQTIWWI